MMNKIEIRTNLAKIGRNLIDGKLFESLRDLNKISGVMGMWRVRSEIEKLQDNYEALLRFSAEGIEDPNYKDLTDTVKSEALALTMQLSRELSLEDGTELYYSTARTMLGKKEETIASTIEAYGAELRRLDKDIETIAEKDRSLKAEQLLRDLFNRIWITHPLTKEDFDAINGMMNDSTPLHARASVISAMGLGHISYYDSNRIAWLLTQYIEYSEKQPQLGLRALIDALTSMLRYRQRPLSKKVKDLLATAKEVKSWNKDFSSVAIELMRTVGTPYITEKIKSGLMGQLDSLDAELRDKLNKGEIDIESIASEYNPEWSEKLDQSALGKNLREMAEIQAEGGDVFMMSFSQMKRFPFFHELPNWFLPFYETHSSVEGVDAEDGILSSLLSMMPVLCDSDKYSLILSLSGIPEGQRKQLATALRAQAEQMADALSETEKITGDALRRHFINKYIQNLYRILNLFRSRKDLYNYFNAGGANPDLLTVDSLAGNPFDDELYETIAEFYFKNGLWDNAIKAFEKIERRSMPDGRRKQQMGYAYERLGMPDKAVEAYEESELICGDSEWTERRMAKALRAIGNFKRAAQYYKRLSDRFPDDVNITISLAETLADSEQHTEAEKYFQKAVYLMPESIGALRGLAKEYFINGHLNKAADLYEKIIKDNRHERDDIVNAAFVQWALKNKSHAIKLFTEFVGSDPEAIDILDADITNNQQLLKEAGVDLSFQNNLIETLRFIQNNK